MTTEPMFPVDSPPTSFNGSGAPPPEVLTANIEASAAEVLTINLVGKKYQIKAPKAALGLKLAVRAKQAEDRPDLMAAAIDEWIDRAFSKEDAADVKYRMYESNDDALDLPHVMELMQVMIERTSDNPST